MKHITTFADFINENFIKESINAKDIKVGTILNFNDGETWKVTKTSGIASGKIFAAPYGDTKKNYVSLPIEFSIDKLEKDVKSLSESQVNESIIDKIKSLFQRTPIETKLLNSLDIFTDDLLAPGEKKYDIVIKKAKSFGMDINREQALEILQKRLAMEIENLK